MKAGGCDCSITLKYLLKMWVRRLTSKLNHQTFLSWFLGLQLNHLQKSENRPTLKFVNVYMFQHWSEQKKRNLNVWFIYALPIDTVFIKTICCKPRNEVKMACYIYVCLFICSFHCVPYSMCVLWREIGHKIYGCSIFRSDWEIYADLDF